MNRTRTLILLSAFLLPACGKQGDEAMTSPPVPAPVPAPGQAVSEAPAPAAAAPEQDRTEAPAAMPETVSPPVVAAPPAIPDQPVAPVAAARPAKPAAPAATGAVPSRDEGLALAQQSGCLACHKIETKLVGPAWQDVSKKYQGDDGARARLIAKVKAGGKGNWTEITGGVMMPPYSPRVSDADIERLVSFVLSL
jgi:cytochrome c